MALRISGDGSLNLSDVTLDNVTASGLSASGDVVLPSTTEIGAVSSTELGYVDGVTSALQTQLNNKAPSTGIPQSSVTDLISDLGSKLDVADQKIIQVVRATDGSRRSTTSTSFVDANLSVTITPTSSSNAILLISSNQVIADGTSIGTRVALTDSSNNLISGAEQGNATDDAKNVNIVLIGYSTPATTSAVTYKQRFMLLGTGTAELGNDNCTGQLYALEIGA